MRVDQQLKPPEGVPQVGPETRWVLYYLTLLIDAVYNAGIMASGELTAGAKSMTPKGVTPGTGGLIVENKSQIPVYVHVRVQPPGSSNPCYMLLAGSADKTTLAKATVVRYGEAPEARVLLKPGEKLYGDVQTSETGQQIFLYTTTPLTGARAVFAPG